MRSKRSNETAEERIERLKKNAQEVRDANAPEDDAMDGMVRKSARLQGP
jgi:hypothetical protein